MSETPSNQPQILQSDTSKQVDINIKEKAQSDNTILNFKKGDFLKDYVKQPTAVPSPTSQPYHSGTTETVEQIREKMLKEEEDESKKMTVEDFEDVADFLIDAFDMLAVFLLRWYAMDSSDAPYQIPVDRMKKLKHRLSRLLMRMQAKFPLGFLFIIGLVLAYASPMKKARDHRKEMVAAKKKVIPPPPPKPTTPPAAAVAPYVPKPTPPVIPAEAVQEAREVVRQVTEHPEPLPPKRPRGRPAK